MDPDYRIALGVNVVLLVFSFVFFAMFFWRVREYSASLVESIWMAALLVATACIGAILANILSQFSCHRLT